MNRKYELLKEDTIKYGASTLYRIKALKDFGDVNSGDLGGYIESEHNLSQNGECWVYDTSKVLNTATIHNNAKIYGNSIISGYSCVCENVKIFDNTNVFGYATIRGNAEISGYSRIFGNAEVYSGAKIHSSLISGNAVIMRSEIGPAVIMNGNEHISQNGNIKCESDYLTMGPIYGMKITSYRSKNGSVNIDLMQGREYFSYTIEEFKHKDLPILTYTKHDKVYEDIINIIEEYFEIK